MTKPDGDLFQDDIRAILWSFASVILDDSELSSVMPWIRGHDLTEQVNEYRAGWFLGNMTGILHEIAYITDVQQATNVSTKFWSLLGAK